MKTDLAAPAQPPELQHVLKGLARNRVPGWNFPANFLDISFHDAPAHCSCLSLQPGPHCLTQDGSTSLAVLSMLLDGAMVAAYRREVGLTIKTVTVAMSVQFTGVPLVGTLEARGRFDGSVQGAVGQHGLVRAELRAGGNLACTASGSYQSLGQAGALPPLPMDRRGGNPDVAPLPLDALGDDERAVYQRAQAALRPGPLSFIDRFWGLQPQPRASGASCELVNGLHIANRVGNTHGGIMFALAAATAGAALDASWRLVGGSVWYLRPGAGPVLRAEADILHQGQRSAVVRTRVAAPQGRPMLEAVTNYAAAHTG